MSSERPSFGKGVKLRREADGAAILLVPEAALALNPSAAAALGLVDGAHTVDEIVASVVDQFEVEPAQARDDVTALFDRLAARGFLR
ncbi:MAG TPA: pyrroloquinoline quinone biosynthesis peptide chaperone PqqD [Candidatus Cybelea sp.]|nr:pyrroloquinoline quinone biosynthesis peptide chaperone PqqD [Candidatus Cybelea sp.]